MRNLLAQDTLRLVKERVAALEPGTKPLWGRMNATEMLAHCAAHIELSLGEIECKSRPGLMALAPVKQIAVYLAPWPRAAPTAPELIRSPDPEAWSAERDKLQGLLDRFPEAIVESSAPHPLFGDLSTRAWGRLAYRHLDHHLRQFGV